MKLFRVREKKKRVAFPGFMTCFREKGEEGVLVFLAQIRKEGQEKFGAAYNSKHLLWYSFLGQESGSHLARIFWLNVFHKAAIKLSSRL